MKARHKYTHEGRTARFNLPVSRRSKFLRLLDSLLAPPARIHRYRHLSVRMLEDTLDNVDCKPCN
jgi:hypothetical protein